MTETGSIDTPDRDGRGGEDRGFARLLWRALFIAVFAAIALLVTDSPASADDCGTDSGECVEAPPADHEAEAQDPASEGRRDPLALVKDTALPAVRQILRVPDQASVDTTATETSPSQPADRPIVHQDGTPTPETGPTGPASASRVPSPTDEKPVTKSTVDLALDLTRDLAQAPRAVTNRVDETVELVGQRRSSSGDQTTGTDTKQGGLSAVTTALTATLPVLELDRIVAPVLTGADDVLTRRLKPVSQLIDPIVVPVLEPSVENTGAALNPVGHRPSGPMPTPTDDGVTSPTTDAGADAATESTIVPAAGGLTRSRVPGALVGTGPASSHTQTRTLQPDQVDDAPWARSAVAVPVSDANVPAPGLDSGDGSGVHGVGSPGGSSADTGKVVMGALRLPGRSSSVGDVVDRWQLPRSFGSEPGHSPD